jgi:acetyl/propionyl-CoA carboxylase alpha subunit
MEVCCKAGGAGLKYCVNVNREAHEAEILRGDGCCRVLWDGEPMDIDFKLDLHSPPNCIIINRKPFEFACEGADGIFSVTLGNKKYEIQVKRGVLITGKTVLSKEISRLEIVKAPMPGLVTAVKVRPEQEVKIGEPLLILEAMKMGNELRSPVNARVQSVYVETGKNVEKGEKLITLSV